MQTISPLMPNLFSVSSHWCRMDTWKQKIQSMRIFKASCFVFKEHFNFFKCKKQKKQKHRCDMRLTEKCAAY